MPFDLPLPNDLVQMGYKVKVLDKENRESPHCTIFRSGSTDKWRWNIREMGFMDDDPDPRLVDRRVLEEIERSICTLRKDWNQRHKINPVNVQCPKNLGECNVCETT